MIRDFFTSRLVTVRLSEERRVKTNPQHFEPSAQMGTKPLTTAVAVLQERVLVRRGYRSCQREAAASPEDKLAVLIIGSSVSNGVAENEPGQKRRGGITEGANRAVRSDGLVSAAAVPRTGRHKTWQV